MKYAGEAQLFIIEKSTALVMNGEVRKKRTNLFSVLESLQPRYGYQKGGGFVSQLCSPVSVAIAIGPESPPTGFFLHKELPST